LSANTFTFESSERKRPTGSLRSVAPPAFSFTPTVIRTRSAPAKSL
jgi:hypothetical protein